MDFMEQRIQPLLKEAGKTSIDAKVYYILPCILRYMGTSPSLFTILTKENLVDRQSRFEFCWRWNWLVVTVFQFIAGCLPERGRKRREKIRERKNVQTTPS